MRLVKTILQPHKIVNSATKHLELTVLKQKQTTRKQPLQHHRDVQALSYRYTATGSHNKPHNLNTVDETTFTLSTERTNFTLDLYPKKWWPTRKSTNRANNSTLKKQKQRDRK